MRAGARLHQFDQHAVGGAGMDEGDAAAVRAGAGLLVDQFHARRLKLNQQPIQVFDFQAKMVHAFPPVGDEFLHRAFRALRLQEFEAAVAHGQKAHRNPIRGHGLAALQRQAERLPERHGRRGVLHREADMIDAHDPRHRCDFLRVQAG